MSNAATGTPEAKLIAHLKTRRWFGGKGREILGAKVRDAIPVQWPNSTKRFAIARVDVKTDAGVSTYQLFAPSAANGQPQADADALADPDFLRGLADAWLKGATFERNGVRWIVESEGRKPLVVPAKAPITLSTAEQTNSSVILNREAMLKLYRKLEPGIHPDVEVTRFLTIERQFVHVPVLLGTARFEDADGVTIAAMLQEYVQGATDAWSHALERLGQAASPSGDVPFARDAEELGTVVRELHENLAAGAPGGSFDLRPAGTAEIHRWTAGARQTISAAITILERALDGDRLSRDCVDAARAVAAQGPAHLTRIDELARSIASDAGGNTRTHGDLHLGQVLRSAAARFLIIDFEGEPARPIAERRARSSPLRDVAGMLRSFAYAAAAGLPRDGARARHWQAAARDAFLRGYFSMTDGLPGLLPRSRDNADRLIALFEGEKVFYELQYELAHRPDWVSIPLRDITPLLR